MKKIAFMIVAMLVMSATCFAGEKTEGKDWNWDVNVSKLGSYLQLNAGQMDEVYQISDYFSEKMKDASYARENRQGKKLREAVYGNFKLMKNTLTDEQYKKYVQLVNVTLRNKGLNTYMEDIASK